MLSLPSPSLFSFRIINKNIGVKVASQERPLRKFPKHRQRIKLNSNYPKDKDKGFLYSLFSKRFRLVSEQKKTVEGDFRF